ncbi:MULTISPECIES: TonB-dependent receptor [unclassified Achromobacter]|uniref:TonB-dependent siderophore receptor n=1 Tax=unclassified Achromobacter TaxID=2626865 RepID=UPI001303F27D|nr:MULTISPECIES: TonB-dependent receptor [unclassified Achromobacter]
MEIQARRKAGAPRTALLIGSLSISLALALGTAVTQANAQNTIVRLDMPAQALGDALLQLGRQTSLQILYAQDLVRGLQAPAVSGTLTPEQALGQLLQGSGIEYVRTGNTVTLAKPPSTGAAQMETVKVVGANDATTEGSGTYAASGASLFKGANSLKEIPQSVSVLTRQQIEDQNLTTIESALNHMTGARVSDFDRGESVYARGYTANKEIDGVPQQNAASAIDTVLYDRIEFLRGPSGLLSGTGNPGGTVNYVLKRPQPEFSVKGAVTVGSWNTRRGELDVTGPLLENGKLRGRGVLMQQSTDGWHDLGDENKRVLFGALEYDFTPDTTLGVSYAHSEYKYYNSYGLPTYSTGNVVSRSSYLAPDRRTTQIDDRLMVDLKHRFANGWSGRAAYSYASYSQKGYAGYAASTVDANTGLANYSLGYLNNNSRWNSVDVNVSGPVRLFEREHVLTFGYSSAISDAKTGSHYTTVRNRDVLNDHDYDAIIAASDLEDIPNRTETYTQQSGVYANARIKLADPLTLVLGSRWTDYSSKTRSVGATPTDWTTGAAQASKKFTPYGGLVWDVNEQVTLYASYADIFIPQTQQDAQGNALDPRVGWQTEVGAKTSWMDGALDATVALFRIRDKNRAMVDPDNVGCGGTSAGTCYRAAGEVQSQGVEFEVTGRPTPQWDIITGYTYNSNKYLSDSNAANVGKRFQAPEHMFKLWTQYHFVDEFNAALAGWTVGGGMYVQSDIDNDTVRQRGYATFSARVAYRINDRWEASVLANNLFDRTYLRTTGYAAYYNSYGEPRNVMLTLRGKF